MQYTWVILFSDCPPSIIPSIYDHLLLLQPSVDSHVRMEVSANVQMLAPVQMAGWGASVKNVSLSSNLTLSPDNLPGSWQLRVTRNWLYSWQGFTCFSCSRPDRAARADWNMSVIFRRSGILVIYSYIVINIHQSHLHILLAHIANDHLERS